MPDWTDNPTNVGVYKRFKVRQEQRATKPRFADPHTSPSGNDLPLHLQKDGVEFALKGEPCNWRTGQHACQTNLSNVCDLLAVPCSELSGPAARCPE